MRLKRVSSCFTNDLYMYISFSSVYNYIKLTIKLDVIELVFIVGICYVAKEGFIF